MQGESELERYNKKSENMEVGLNGALQFYRKASAKLAENPGCEKAQLRAQNGYSAFQGCLRNYCKLVKLVWKLENREDGLSDEDDSPPGHVSEGDSFDAKHDPGLIIERGDVSDRQDESPRETKRARVDSDPVTCLTPNDAVQLSPHSPLISDSVKNPETNSESPKSLNNIQITQNPDLKFKKKNFIIRLD